MADNLKNLFEINSNQFLSAEDLNSVGDSVESADYVDAFTTDRTRFIPPVDFDDPANFAKFGSAKDYYVDAVTKVYKTYPYDGSGAEKLEYANSSSYLDRWILKSRYPKSTGYANFNTAPTNTWIQVGEPNTKEYIHLYGGPGTGSIALAGKPLAENFAGTNVYNTTKGRDSNLKWDWSTDGNTVECWIKLGELSPTTENEYQTIFHLANEVTPNAGSARLWIYYRELPAGPDAALSGFYANVYSGSAGATSVEIPLYTVGDGLDYAATGSWAHYAFTFKNEPGVNSVRYKTYKNGSLVKNSTNGTGLAYGNVTGSLQASIGAIHDRIRFLPAAAFPFNEFYPSLGAGDVWNTGWMKLSGSVDEVRYWKKERTAEEIGKYWFTQVNGGTNTDDANTDLGVYYKFNEGITGNSKIDSIALDYSGRVTNGTWVGYDSTYSRNTGSAIVSASASPFEIEDPIIYSTHPDVSLLLKDLRDSGSAYDRTNNSSIYNSIPDWITTEDDSTLLKLTQIMSSYLDSLYLQIEHLPKLKDTTYLADDSFKALPYAGNLLDSAGFVSPEIFVDADVLEQLLSRTEKILFDEKLHNIKNLIYQNIYNNLVYIYKSKGTEKAFRNLVRCYGIGDDLVKLNIYADNATHTYEDNFQSTTVKKNAINFNTVDNFGGTIYQHSSSLNTNSESFLSGGVEKIYIPRTIESNVFFPKKLESSQQGYFETNFLTASLFGMHTARAASPGQTTYDSPDRGNFQVFAVRDKKESKSVRFKLTASAASGIPELTTSLFEDVYDNQAWNISVRIKSAKYPVSNYTDGTGLSSEDFEVEFTGYNNILDVTYNSFALSGTMSTNARAQAFLSSSHRIYAGAHLTNFTGTIQQRTDARTHAVRYWMDYLEDDELKTHAQSSLNYGRKHPHRDAYPLITDVLRTRVPQKDTLALNWDFQQVTSSDSSGKFLVADFSSGSQDFMNQKYGFLGNVLEAQHPGFGYNFPASDPKVVDIDYQLSAQKSLPEDINSSDMVQILDNDDVVFTRDSRPIRHFFAFEKSMYDTISQEMLDMFSTVKDFSNLVGNPVNRYRGRYKDLTKLRNLFFERVENIPSLDKYVEFYKWIDSSLGLMLNQLVPASSDFAEDVRNVVESHVLERSKYKTKFPTLELNINKIENPIAASVGTRHPLPPHLRIGDPQQLDGLPLLGGNILSPLPRPTGLPGPRPENVHGPYWQRTADVPRLDLRQGIIDARTQKVKRQDGSPVSFGTFSEEYIHGGINFSKDKKIEYTIGTTTFQSSDAAVSVPANSLVSSSLLDSVDLERAAKVGYQAITTLQPGGVKGSVATPFNLVEDQKGVISGDYNSVIHSGFATNVIVTNLHGEQEEIPMQSPFTDAWVGGRQFRHADITVIPGESDAGEKRPEAWRLDVNSGASRIEFRDPVMGAAGSTKGNARSKLFRGVRAKRPLNIENIPYTTASPRIGNYNKNYEIVTTSGRTINNLAFVQDAGYAQLTPENHFFSHSGPIPGTLNFALPDQALEDGTYTKTVIANHFNAPGGKDVSSRGVLNPSSEEYAAGNALPWRNRTVRLDQQKKLTLHTGQFGVYPYNQYGLKFRRSHVDYMVVNANKPNALGTMISSNNISVSFWIRAKEHQATSAGHVFSIDGDTGFDQKVFNIAIDPAGATNAGRLRLEDSAGTTIFGDPAASPHPDTSIIDNKWHHYVFALSAGNAVSIFRDGMDVTPTPNTITYTFASTDRVTIGTRYRGSGVYWALFNLTADLDELSVWSSTLSISDVTSIYNGGYPNNLKELSIAPASLTAWYRMGDDGYIGKDSQRSNRATIRSGAPDIITDVLPSKTLPTRPGAAQQGNRNFVKRLELANGLSTHMTGVVADNAYITHPIPRSDTQYRWIRDSYQHTDVFGHAIEEDDITFVSIGDASVLEQLGTYSNNLVYETIWSDAVELAADKFNRGYFRDGLQMGRQILNMFSPAELPAPLAVYANTLLGTPPSPAGGIFSPDYFNILMATRNGLGGFSTWKQIRTGEHPIARYLTANNYLTYTEDTLNIDGALYEGIPSAKSFIDYSWPDSIDPRTVTNHRQTTYFVTEPPIAVNSGPAMVEYQDVGTGQFHVSAFSVVNAVDTFANDVLISKRDKKQKMPESYETFLKGFKETGKLKLKKISLKNSLYPRAVNTTLAKVRGRLQYDETIAEAAVQVFGQQRLQWRDLLQNRLRNPNGSTVLTFLNSLKVPTLFQVIEGATKTTLGLPSRTTTGASSIYALDPISLSDASDDYKAGELLQDTRLSIGIAAGGQNLSEPSQTFWLSGTGDGTQHPGGMSTSAAEGHPTADLYQDFSENIRRPGIDYTIVPEFRISEHMEYYLANGFDAQNNAFLTGEGFGTSTTDLNTSAPGETDPYDGAFFSTYSHTDFMKYFGQMRSDYTDLAVPSKIALQCDVIKKLLPYQGFYPMNRCVQLGTLFVSSHGANITGESTRTVAVGNQDKDFLASATQPLFAPGILYNTIKSGLGYGYPIYTTEPTFENPGGVTNLMWAQDNNVIMNILSTAPDFQLDFEDLLLGGYPLNTDMYMIRRKTSGSVAGLNSYTKVKSQLTELGDDRYVLAMHNFLASVGETFLERPFNTFHSKQRDRWSAMQQGYTYYMDISVWKTADMVQAEGPRGNYGGAAPASVWDWTACSPYAVALGRNTAAAANPSTVNQDPGGALYTPCYFYGKDTVTLAFKPDEIDQLMPPSLDKLTSTSSMTITDVLRQNLDDSLLPDLMNSAGILLENRFKVTSSVDIFERTRRQNITYDGDGQITSIGDGDSDKTDLDVWAIATKFECPTLNFSASQAPYLSRGIWGPEYAHPTDSQGIYVAIEESDAVKNNTDPKAKSLVQVCGFDTTPRKVGEIAAKKEIFEAIVAIPFTEIKKGKNKGSKRFIKINKSVLKQQMNNKSKTGMATKHKINTSITSMMESLPNYVMPPHLDFIRNKLVDPFVVYLFEFKQELNRDDLADIWQGVQPRISKDPELESASLVHDLEKSEFFHGKPLPEDLRWMVFKVKQRASNNYFNARRRAIDGDNRITNAQGKEKEFDFSYNWPYDFCSLIELAKIDSGIEMQCVKDEKIVKCKDRGDEE